MKVLVLVCICSIVPYAVTQCVPSPNVTPGPHDPPLPTFPDEFQTRVEANIQEKNYSVTAIEYFSVLNKKASVHLIRDGDESILLYDYSNNQLFYVKDNQCKIGNLSSDPNTMLFGDDMINGIPHIVTSKAALHFLKSNGQVYKGPATVRGISTDHWQTCLQWPKLKSTFILDYYFTAEWWADPVAFPQIPVRAVVTGMQMQDSGQSTHFSHTYDYIDFRPEVQDVSVFETPSGVICYGRVSKKPVPTLPNKYHYRTEIITSEEESIVTTDVWYDDDYKLVRYDYKNVSPIPPLYTVNPLSEVHDFNTGIRYIRDQVTGNCTILPISNTSFDVFESQGTFSSNTSYIVHMKNPMQFFYLDNSYRYVGMRKARGVFCDVFSTYRTDFMLAGLKTNATFEYYFLSDIYTEHPDDGSTNPIDVPYMLLINIFSFGEDLPDFTLTYNFLDFDEGHPDMSVYDVTACYSNQASLQFEVRFPGAYHPYTDLQIRQQAQNLFAINANVSNIRIQNVQLQYDNSNVYVTATLLDRSPPSSQFTLVAKKSIEQKGDQTYGYVANVKDCAQYCIDSVNFVCNSYEWCSGDEDNNCRLSKRHIGDGSVIHESTCDHYSRTVTGPVVEELDVYRAYNNLRQVVYSNLLQIPAYEADMTTTYYNAIDIDIKFGWLSPDPFPAIDSQFSYLLEIIVPKIKSAYDSHIWYDYKYKLLRYDLATSPPSSKFNTGNPMSYINDFNTGLAYITDRTFGNCSITPLGNDTFDSDPSSANAGYIVHMKNPLDFLYADNTYKYAGQKTMRGILCIVFETITDQFKLQGVTTKFTSRLQFYFAYDDWKMTPTGSNIPVQSQPVRLDVSSEEIGLFITYNFIDFNLQDPDLTNFDITPCFGGTQKRDFSIRFPGAYHPVLDSNVKVFLKTAQTTLAKASMSSPIRFQKTELVYDQTHVYLIGTLVDVAPFIADFTKTSSKLSTHKSDAKFNQVKSASDCATMCRAESNFACEGFDYCSATSTCLLSREHVDDGPILTSSTACDHYSRTVNSTDSAQPGIDAIMIKLNDVVYKGLFQIPIFYGGNTTIFIADKIRDNIVRSNRDPTSSQVLQHFNVAKNNILARNHVGYVAGISVDECADACLTEMTFDCLAFDFCFKKGDCLLYRYHPDAQPSNLTHHDFCDLYSRTYLDKYTPSPGMVVSVAADKEIDSVNSDNLCAKQCSQYTAFPCKSFQYCSNTKTCRLMKKHQLDFPANALVASPTCSFYTRNYIDDFQKKSRSAMKFGVTIDYTDVTVDDCAKLCMTTEASNCQTFAFCNTTSLCRLTSNTPVHNGVTQDVCDLYIKKRNPFNGPQTNTAASTGSSNTNSNTGYSAGAMAGVGIGLFLPGIVIGAVIAYFFRRKQELAMEQLDMQQLVKD